LGVEGGGASLEGKQQRRSFDEAKGKKPSSTTATPAPPSAAGKLVLEKLTLYETKTVRSPEVCALRSLLMTCLPTETLRNRFQPGRLSLSSAQD
jgi:hypothetical protein